MAKKLENKKQGKAEIRQLILSTAEEEFANKGYAGARIGDIAERGGFNPATIHYYFDSKENLYNEVVDTLFKKWEIHIREISWLDHEPEVILRKYIRAHFEFQCRNPNLYKIVQLEMFESGYITGNRENILFTHGSIWLEDIRDKVNIIQAWQNSGKLIANINGWVLLECIWGMMKQFYYLSHQELTTLLPSTQSLEEIHQDLIEQFTQIILAGVLSKPQVSSGSSDTQIEQVNDSATPLPTPLHIVLPSEELLFERATTQTFLDAVHTILPAENKTIGTFEQIESSMKPAHIVLFLYSRLGEIPKSIQQFMDHVSQHSALYNNSYIAIWVDGDYPETLQQLLEQYFNRAGLFVLSRLPEQTSWDYIRRFRKLLRGF